MTYIGQQPSTTFDSGIQDRFTGLSSNTVTLNHEISAEEDILVVWNNIVQDKNTYSVGGTGNKTVTLGGTLSSSDVVTVYYQNKVLQSVNPTAGSVTSTILGSDILSGQTDIGGAIADADLFLVDDGAGGTVRKTAASRLKTYIGSGLSNASQWRLTTSFTGDKSPINANWEQVDAPVGFGILGSAMTESSGIFTFPSTGYWYVGFHLSVFSDSQGATAYIEGEIETTTNNSTYAVAANPRLNLGGNSYSMSTYGSFIKDVTNTSNDKVRFDVNTNAGTVIGNTGYNRTYVVFIRLGDT